MNVCLFVSPYFGEFDSFYIKQSEETKIDILDRANHIFFLREAFGTWLRYFSITTQYFSLPVDAELPVRARRPAIDARRRAAPVRAGWGESTARRTVAQTPADRATGSRIETIVPVRCSGMYK